METRAPRVSARLDARFDVIVVGSGFGGSVCAARLAEKGMRVLVLERGPWWGPAHRDRPAADRRELPRGPLGSRKLLRSVRYARGGRRVERVFHVDGLQEAHVFEHLNVLTASGVGGGSHLYTNIMEEPPEEFFEAFPAELRGGELRPWFDRVRAVLRPAPVPTVPPRTRHFAAALVAAGLPPAEAPDLAIAWGADPSRQEAVTNAVGVQQSTSTFRSDAFVGCEDGSKTTLDLTYVPLALRHGAELRPLCEVLSVAADQPGYAVRYHDHRDGRDHEVRAPRLVLAAGGLNTQRLLFAARDGHGGLPALSGRLGQRFSPNADMVALLWRTAALRDSSYGPAVGAVCHVSVNGRHRYLIGELGPPALALPLPGPLRRRLGQSLFLFGMGRDASTGTLGFDGTGLITEVGRSLDPALFVELEDALLRIARHYRPRRVISNVLAGWGPEGLFTVHPLGGCAMGAGPEEGVTDHRGAVFGYPGLFVADGSLYPRAPGTAPSLTIAALAERQAALME